MDNQAQRQLHEQCEYETQIAAKLRSAGRAERMNLYGELYNGYYAAFPVSRPPVHIILQRVRYELAFARRFISPDTIVAEVGSGRCELAFALAAVCRSMHGIDVVDMSSQAAPPNFRLLLTDGTRMPLPDQSVEVVISNQMMEHLHPDDATEQLHEIFRILQPGGRYICMTPNRLHGPHDSSAYFDDLPCPVENGTYVANGLHLKEYTNVELSQLFRAAGFRRCGLFAGAKGTYARVPAWLMALTEQLARRIPLKLRKRSKVLQVLLGVRIVAEK
jgi:SAM-dependent methyltransferase